MLKRQLPPKKQASDKMAILCALDNTISLFALIFYYSEWSDTQFGHIDGIAEIPERIDTSKRNDLKRRAKQDWVKHTTANQA